MADQTAPQRTRSPRIAILGAGPAGLATGYFLKCRGYKDVMIFEKLGRVGGLCKSVTDGYMSFDLGGTYVTPAYHETLKIARAVRAERYRGKRYKMVKVVGEGKDKKLEKGDAWKYARRGLDDSAEKNSILRIARGVFGFWWERQKVRRYVDGPSFERVDERPDLCVSFGQWLDDRGIGFMRRLFEIPVTMMGYGFLDEVAAPYVLKYMSPGTYWSMFLRGLPGIGFFWAWPQRFREGFQRMWERVSWGLDVRMDVKVLRVRRGTSHELPIEIDIDATDPLCSPADGVPPRTLHFDKLILACPLTLQGLSEFFCEESAGDPTKVTLSEEEIDLFGRIEPHIYVQNTLHAVTVDADGQERPFKLYAPVVPVFPFDETTFGKPWVVVQVWGNQSRLLQFYTRVEAGERPEQTRAAIDAACHELLALFGGIEAGATRGHERLARWTTFDRWPYFHHVNARDMESGFFRRLDLLQGKRDTYYTGGATTFEMVEAIVRHARYIAEKVDRDLRTARFPKPRAVPFRPLHPPYASIERLSADGS